MRRWWRRLFSRRAWRRCSWSCLLLRRLLLVVLVVRHIILISTVRRIWILTTIVLCILRTVVRGAGRSTHAWRGGCWCSGRRWRLLSISSVCTIRVRAVAAVAIPAIAALWRVLLEALVLFTDVGEEIDAKLFGTLNFFRVRSADGMVSRTAQAVA